MLYARRISASAFLKRTTVLLTDCAETPVISAASIPLLPSTNTSRAAVITGSRERMSFAMTLNSSIFIKSHHHIVKTNGISRANFIAKNFPFGVTFAFSGIFDDTNSKPIYRMAELKRATTQFSIPVGAPIPAQYRPASHAQTVVTFSSHSAASTASSSDSSNAPARAH